ncbi:MAG TPA: tetratricopeptide repeat protein [Pyrinomonadaceae bacterium]
MQGVILTAGPAISRRIHRRTVAIVLLAIFLIVCNAPHAQEQMSVVITTGLFAEPHAVYLFMAPSKAKIEPAPLNLPIASLRNPAPAQPINATVPFKMSAAQALKIGSALTEDGDFESALPYFEESHRLDASLVEAEAGLGDCYYELRRDDEAINTYKEVIGRKPDIWRSHFNLGRIYLERGQFAEAVESLTTAAKIKPTDIDTLSSLGIALEKKGDNQKAIENLIVVTQAPSQKFNASVFYALGEAYANDKQWLPAAQAFKAGAEIRGIDPDAYSHWATMLYYADNLEEAIQAYIKVKSLDLNQSHYESSLFLADAYRRTNKPNDALASYRHVLRFKPENVDSLVFGGYLLVQLSQLNEAEQFYKKAIAVDPKQADALTNLAALQSRDNEKRMRLSQPTPGLTLREVVAANPNLGEAHVNLGAQLITEKVYPEAVTVLQRAVTLLPESAAANFNLGLAQFKTNDFDKAIISIKKTLQLKPGWSEAYNILGLAYAGLNRWDDAFNAYQEAVNINPRYAGARFNLGTAYMKLGNKTAALKEVDNIKPLDFDLGARLSNWIFSLPAPTPVVAETTSTPAATPVPTPVTPTVTQPSTTPTPTQKVETSASTKADKSEVGESGPAKAVIVEKTCPGPIYRPTDVAQMAQITSRLEIDYTDDARTNNVQGKLILRAVLCGDGIVSDITVEQLQPYGLTERAIEAMKKIEFQPALIDGKPVSVMIRQEFVCSQSKCTAVGTGPPN